MVFDAVAGLARASDAVVVDAVADPWDVLGAVLGAVDAAGLCCILDAVLAADGVFGGVAGGAAGGVGGGVVDVAAQLCLLHCNHKSGRYSGGWHCLHLHSNRR